MGKNHYLRNIQLVDEWERIVLENPSYRRSVRYLKDYRYIRKSVELEIEVFQGKATRRLKSEDLDPDLQNNYKYPSIGAHSNDAFDPAKGGITRIIGQKIAIVGHLGYYEAQVEMFNPYLQQWVKNRTNGGFSTFFRDDWSKEKKIQEMTVAFTNRKCQYSQGGSAIFKGPMTDNNLCTMYIKNGEITMHSSFR